MNQNYVPEHANPVMRDYTGDSSGVQVYDAPGREPASNSNDDGTDYYLIAFKDHSIYSAFAYWVDGDTLHYVTPQRVHNQVSVALVDRELTDKLNRGRDAGQVAELERASERTKSTSPSRKSYSGRRADSPIAGRDTRGFGSLP